jgi:hypothetical protein
VVRPSRNAIIPDLARVGQGSKSLVCTPTLGRFRLAARHAIPAISDYGGGDWVLAFFASLHHLSHCRDSRVRKLPTRYRSKRPSSAGAALAQESTAAGPPSDFARTEPDRDQPGGGYWPCKLTAHGRLPVPVCGTLASMACPMSWPCLVQLRLASNKNPSHPLTGSFLTLTSPITLCLSILPTETTTHAPYISSQPPDLHCLCCCA